MENSSPFMGDPAPTVDRHTTTVFAGRPILRVVTLSLMSVNYNRPIICFHFQFYDSICRPPLSSGLMTVLWQLGQFSAFGNSLPSFFNHDQQQISCFIHSSKIVNYHNAVAEDIPFIWQKIKRNLTSFNECSSSLPLILFLAKY